jgi:UDP-N-acetylmuramate--alanine ligase
LEPVAAPSSPRRLTSNEQQGADTIARVPLPAWMNDAEAHPLPALDGARLHLRGVGGRGLAPLAAAAKHLGADVTGCDPRGQPRMRALLRDAGIDRAEDHDPAHLDDGRALVATASAPAGDPEIEAARAAGRLHRRMDLTAAVLAARPGLGVTGSHGKGTVAALAAGAARAAGLDPMSVLGVDVPQLGGAFHAAPGPAIVEVDGSDLAAHFVTCDVATVTNLDDDHPYMPVTVAEEAASVAGFVANARTHVILGPSPRRELIARSAGAPVWRIGVDVVARVTGQRDEGTLVRIEGPGDGERVEALVRLVGPATATNAALAYASARALGADPEAAAAGLAAIDRLDRRLEPLGRHRGVWVYDDFGAKHPAAVRGGLVALRRRHPGARIIAVFEPLFGATIRTWGWRYTRALRLADLPIILPTVEHPDYPATDDPALREWFREIGGAVVASATPAAAARLAARRAKPGDVIVGIVQMNQRGVDLREAVIEALDQTS